jgi:hypothetical protein
MGSVFNPLIVSAAKREQKRSEKVLDISMDWW